MIVAQKRPPAAFVSSCQVGETTATELAPLAAEGSARAQEAVALRLSGGRCAKRSRRDNVDVKMPNGDLSAIADCR
jgi:hypothetical protein